MSCPAVNGTYNCQRRASHRGDHAHVGVSDRTLRWNSHRTYSERTTNILERAFAGEDGSTLTPEQIAQAAALAGAFMEAAEGDSGDAEFSAAWALAEHVQSITQGALRQR